MSTSSTATACSTSCRISRHGTSIGPVAGVYVANPGYVFGKAAIPRGSIVTGIGSDTLDDLDDLERVLESLPDDAQVPVRFVTFDEPQTERQRLDHERSQLVPGAALPPRRSARRLAVPSARAKARRANR